MSSRVCLCVLLAGLAAWSLLPAGIAGAEEAEPTESTVSSPPMEMDDPGTPGARGIEVNLVGSWLRAGPGRGAEMLLDANLGIGDRLQLKLERPWVREWEVGASSENGLGATELGVKWRFVERGGLEIGAYPQYEFDDAFTLHDEDGNPEETAGRSVYVPVLISKAWKQAYTLAANVGYRRNLEDRGDDVNLAVGVGRALGENARVLTEVFSERDEHFDNRQTDVRIGGVAALFPGALQHSALELDGFASIGHSVGATEEGESATSFIVGLSIVKRPAGE